MCASGAQPSHEPSHTRPGAETARRPRIIIPICCAGLDGSGRALCSLRSLWAWCEAGSRIARSRLLEKGSHKAHKEHKESQRTDSCLIIKGEIHPRFVHWDADLM